MNVDQIIRQLASAARLVPAKNAEAQVPDCPGLYSIFVDHAKVLPSPFGEHLSQKRTSIIYLGKASRSLQTRLVRQDLRHKQPSTFFRGIGAILGYEPLAGSLKGKKNQNNYKFGKRDTESIVDWIDSHLSIRWITTKSEEVEVYEGAAISALKPLLNTSNNPDPVPELAELRQKCRLIARS